MLVGWPLESAPTAERTCVILLRRSRFPAPRSQGPRGLIPLGSQKLLQTHYPVICHCRVTEGFLCLSARRIFSITSCRRRRGDGKRPPTRVSHSARGSGGPLEIIDPLASALMRRAHYKIHVWHLFLWYRTVFLCVPPYYSSLGFSRCSSQIFGRKLFNSTPVAETSIPRWNWAVGKIRSTEIPFWNAKGRFIYIARFIHNSNCKGCTWA